MSSLRPASANPVFDAMAIADDPRKAANLVPALEGLGYGRAYFAEASLDVFSVVGAASQHATRIELGTDVAIAFARTPMVVAYSAATLQLLSEGRFVLGLGSQVRGHIVRRFGMPWSAPAERMRSFVLALRAIWHSWRTGEPLNFVGQDYSHTLMSPGFAPRLGRLPDPAIHLAGVGPLMTEVAGAVADGFLLHPFHTPNTLRSVTIPALRRGADSAGRTLGDLEVTAQFMGVSGDTDEEMASARAAARNQVAFYGSTPSYALVLNSCGFGDLHPRLNALSKAGRWNDMAELVDDELIDAICVTGTPAEMVAQARSRSAGLAQRVVITPAPMIGTRTDPDRTMRWYESIAGAARP